MGTDEFSRMRKEEDLEGDTLGCSIKEVVTKEIRFLLNPSFQLLWSACSLWPVADGKPFPLMKLDRQTWELILFCSSESC